MTEVSFSKLHRKLVNVLYELGIDVDVEVEFYPKVVDCYSSLYHVAFEADGPYHTRKKDAERDDYLMANYALPVIHIGYEHLRNHKKATREVVRQLLRVSWLDSAWERRLIAQRISEEC